MGGRQHGRGVTSRTDQAAARVPQAARYQVFGSLTRPGEQGVDLRLPRIWAPPPWTCQRLHSALGYLPSAELSGPGLRTGVLDTRLDPPWSEACKLYDAAFRGHPSNTAPSHEYTTCMPEPFALPLLICQSNSAVGPGEALKFGCPCLL